MLFNPLGRVIASNELPRWDILWTKFRIDSSGFHLRHLLINGQLRRSLRLVRFLGDSLLVFLLLIRILRLSPGLFVDLITGLLGLFSGLSWHRSDISIRLHHAFIDASKPTKDTVTLMSELLRVVLSGSLLRHVLAQGLDGALKGGLFRD